MGAKPPEQKTAHTEGSGLTFQRTEIPLDIQRQSQNAFRGGLNNAFYSTQGVLGANPQFQNVGAFNPEGINLQSQENSYDLGPLYSSTLDPLVQAQLSKASSDRAGQAQAQNTRLAQTLGPGNSALISALGTQGIVNSQLQAGPEQLAALQQQREMDLSGRQAAVQAAQLEQARMGQVNQAQLQGREAEQQAYQTNLAGSQFNNQATQQDYMNQVQGAQLQQELLKSLGQGLIQTAPQYQSQFTVQDMLRLQKKPGTIDEFLENVPGGLIGNPLSYKGSGIAPKYPTYYGQTLSPQKNPFRITR